MFFEYFGFYVYSFQEEQLWTWSVSIHWFSWGRLQRSTQWDWNKVHTFQKYRYCIYIHTHKWRIFHELGARDMNFSVVLMHIPLLHLWTKPKKYWISIISQTQYGWFFGPDISIEINSQNPGPMSPTTDNSIKLQVLQMPALNRSHRHEWQREGRGRCQGSHMEQMFQSNQALLLWPFYCINIGQIRWA